MSIKDLEDFQNKYGDEYNIENSPVARWVAEYGYGEGGSSRRKHNDLDSHTLKEMLRLNSGKNY